ncbi:MAG: response regulator transcription factor [Candidatus Omnitrophica bacterium]|nr:response regulator transcription factor [Candidatus Omnitrophota bacterium]
MISEKIVVIDDDERIAKSFRIAFPEYEIISFDDGRKALEYLARPNESNMVFLDVMMPKMNGLSVLAEIRKLKKDFGVVLMTAFASKDIAIEALRNHADDFIEKPFQIPDVKDKIRQILKVKLHDQNLRQDKGNQVERIKHFVQRNYSEAKLDYVASELCLSPKYISRIFSREHSMNFRNYKLQIRMDRAKELLRTTKLNVSEIALDLGYQNPESFMRIFKRMIKMTPSKYRSYVQQKTQKK